MSRTRLILRQWVERDGCKVTAYQAYAWDTGNVITSRTETLRVFKFHNEWRAKLCAHRMNYCKYEVRKRTWLKYFHNHVNPPEMPQTVLNASMWFLLRPDVVFVILGIFIIWCAYH